MKIKLSNIIKKIIFENSNDISFKLKAGEGNWYALYYNGTVYLEGNDKFMKEKLLKLTNKSLSEITDLLDDALTTWVNIDINLAELKKLYPENLMQNPILKNTYKLLT